MILLAGVAGGGAGIETQLSVLAMTTLQALNILKLHTITRWDAQETEVITMWVDRGGNKDLKGGSACSSDPSVWETPNGLVITILAVKVCFPFARRAKLQ